MPNPTSAGDHGPALSFERAEFEGTGRSPAAVCKVCQQPIADRYYEINGHVTCAGCRARVLAARDAGSGAGRFLRAALLGTQAGVAGFVLYFGVAKLTGYEFGLIAIVVGFLVGKAVQIGSHNRGGRLYQLLAVLLTYVSIASTYVPALIEQLAKERDTAAHAAATTSPEAAPGPTDPATPAEAPASAAAAAANTPGTAEANAAASGPLETALALASLVGLMLALPFLAGFQNVIGILIIGFGVYEAWKLNQRRPFQVTGPHALATRSARPTA
jgi:hypothetical protein